MSGAKGAEGNVVFTFRVTRIFPMIAAFSFFSAYFALTAVLEFIILDPVFIFSAPGDGPGAR
jgi:hypothetical protein